MTNPSRQDVSAYMLVEQGDIASSRRRGRVRRALRPAGRCSASSASCAPAAGLPPGADRARRCCGTAPAPGRAGSPGRAAARLPAPGGIGLPPRALRQAVPDRQVGVELDLDDAAGAAPGRAGRGGRARPAPVAANRGPGRAGRTARCAAGRCPARAACAPAPEPPPQDGHRRRQTIRSGSQPYPALNSPHSHVCRTCAGGKVRQRGHPLIAFPHGRPAQVHLGLRAAGRSRTGRGRRSPAGADGSQAPMERRSWPPKPRLKR